MSEEGIKAVKAHLDEHGVPYEEIDYDESFTAAAMAQASGIDPNKAVDGVVLIEDDMNFMLALIPASRRLDVSKAEELLGANSSLRPMTEDEISVGFSRIIGLETGFEVGAVPPFAGLYKIGQAIDSRLLEHERVLCNAGDHAHGVLVDLKKLLYIVLTKTGDLCKE